MCAGLRTGTPHKMRQTQHRGHFSHRQRRAREELGRRDELRGVRRGGFLALAAAAAAAAAVDGRDARRQGLGHVEVQEKAREMLLLHPRM